MERKLNLAANVLLIIAGLCGLGLLCGCVFHNSSLLLASTIASIISLFPALLIRMLIEEVYKN